jgi:hypothetical protein
MDILRVFSELIVILSLCITIWGDIRNRKVTKELKKQNGTEIIRKETPQQTLDELKVANRLSLIGVITATVFGIIAIII